MAITKLEFARSMLLAYNSLVKPATNLTHDSISLQKFNKLCNVFVVRSCVKLSLENMVELLLPLVECHTISST